MAHSQHPFVTFCKAVYKCGPYPRYKYDCYTFNVSHCTTSNIFTSKRRLLQSIRDSRRTLGSIAHFRVYATVDSCSPYTWYQIVSY